MHQSLNPCESSKIRVKVLQKAAPNPCYNDAGTCNINRNKGTCHYGFYAYDENNNDYYLLAEFIKQQNTANFNIEYNTAYFYNDSNNNDTYGKTKTGITLTTNTDSNLIFSVQNINLSTDKYAIGIIEDSGTIKPGDDMQLRFGLAFYNNMTDTVCEGDFMAVIDAKLLWRANLYINEGADDWNNRHPWIEDNEWNREYDGETRLQNYSTSAEVQNAINNLTEGNGGQVINNIHEFTYCRYNSFVLGWNNFGPETDQDAVAYSYGCQDSPFEYNDEMYQQRFLLNHHIINGLDGYIQNNNGWDSTLAPGNPSLDADTQQSHIYYTYIYPGKTSELPTLIQLNNNDNYHITVDGERYFPYIPSWSLNKISDTHYWVNAMSAGIDCNGLVQISAGYQGNNYVWPELHRHDPDVRDSYDTEDHGLGNRAYPTPGRNLSWEITNKDNTSTVITNGIPQIIYNELDKVVPGDVFYWDEHIGIVLSIAYDNNTRNTSINQIMLIESAAGRNNNSGNNRYAKVVNFNQVSVYSGYEWHIVRLRINN